MSRKCPILPVIIDIYPNTFNCPLNMATTMVTMTCRDHPHLMWSCKRIAISDGRYNGSRNLAFKGTPSGEGPYADGSGVQCTIRYPDGSFVHECTCPVSMLEVVP